MSMNHEMLMHHGVKGQKWGVRRYQNSDGSLTDKGKKRYGKLEKKVEKKQKMVAKKRKRQARWTRMSEFTSGFGPFGIGGSKKLTRFAAHRAKRNRKKADRGERKIKRYLEEMEKLKPGSVQHSDDIPENPIVSFVESLNEEQKTFFYCLMDELLDDDDISDEDGEEDVGDDDEEDEENDISDEDNEEDADDDEGDVEDDNDISDGEDADGDDI